MKILIIEDEPQLMEVISTSLKKEFYIIETASNYLSASEKIAMYEYDCILLDINLPDGNGLDLLTELDYSEKTGNVIIISARDSLDDKLKGLELGADDYLTKPFHLAELNARIKAVVRRKQLNGKYFIDIENTTINIKERTLTVNQNLIALNRKEFDILNYFMVNPNRLITKSTLAEHVWGDQFDEADNFDFIYYQIKNLRKKLIESQAEIEIESIYGVGYKLVVK